ncbi:tRNA-uridine aminocarboxypropyltransferase [Thiomicrorhabdus xiamenensis]|uniref:tRNA-uridine aminocarboxypropyltransferase n=1 Tax=Thiomicrorhabdus xiamenensis TaxID=2739063 RepID=A0A7D4SHT0_9GAMM|nr:tRNA-uridine aminocarboxypropyltransferase [Thiomicrorhabdus xiamenensis]QKI88660.1 DTW domain-containing protein [Thiomicrorhabdus xiamenensis]
MARTICQGCVRPVNACWCHCSREVGNRIEIGILQHPDEAKQAKSTVPLLVKSLNWVQLWKGETVAQALVCTESLKDGAMELDQWLANGKRTYLLYPKTEEDLPTLPVVTAESLRPSLQNSQILVLDGTWRKTYKMLMLNPQLQSLPRITIQPGSASQYFIRKQKNSDSLSTLEAVGELLGQLQQDNSIRTDLNEAFDCFQKSVFHKRLSRD